MGRLLVFFVSISLVLGVHSGSQAEEGGTGHYLPGSISSYVDGTPTDPILGARLNLIYYNGSIDHSLPIAGTSTANIEATSFAYGLTLFYRPSFELADGLSYALSASIPFVSLEVTGDVIVGTQTVRRTDKTNGLGDIIFIPIQLNYDVATDTHLDFRLATYMPTGEYNPGELANTGKNYWTFEPTLGLLYFGHENGRAASVFAGFDFNSTNTATDYHTGSQFHLDGSATQNFPLLNGLTGAGLSGFWYEQVSGDSGTGATFGEFKGRTTGLGPVISYIRQTSGIQWIAELKWLHEFETRHRLEGEYIWLKIVAKF